MFGKLGGGGEVKGWNKKKEKEMKVPCIRSVWFTRENGKEKKSSCSSTDSLFSLFPSNLRGKENVGLIENSAFSFPSFHFSPKKVKEFSFPSYLCHPLLSLQLPFNHTYIYIYIYIYMLGHMWIMLGTYVTILCNWLILWQNALYL